MSRLFATRSPHLTLALMAIAVVGFSGVIAALSWWWLGQPSREGGEQIVHIKSGMTARQIGEVLRSRGLVRSASAFSWAARLHGLEHELEAGRYRLSGTQSTSEILKQLLRAPLEMRRVTVPEGLTLSEVAALLESHGVADSARFANLAADLENVKRHGVTATSLEGYLFPETYFIDRDAPEEEILARMVGQFFDVTDALLDRMEELGMSLNEVVTLASIVEREAMVAAERPVISAIFHKRLRLRRRLESCATVEYALGVHKKRLTNEDLKVNSPFNTYLHRGLPPGPIGNPGRASLHAALYPSDTDYLYFVARGDGTHTFSRSNKEHEVAKRAIKREMRRRRQRGS